VIYALQVNAEIRRYRLLLAEDPEGFQRIELAHIRGTRQRFIGYNLFEIGLTLAGAGIAAYGVLADSDVSKGIGIGLAAVGLPFFIIDSVNNVRARDYENRVLGFLKRVSFVPGGTGRPWSLSFGGSF